MFTPSDYDYRKLKTLSLGDFLPSRETKDTMTAACKSILWGVFKSFAHSNKVDVPNLICPMPIVFPLNHLERSEILSLPTYPFNEGIINEVIDIHECIGNDIGMSDKQRMENMIDHVQRGLCDCSSKQVHSINAKTLLTCQACQKTAIEM